MASIWGKVISIMAEDLNSGHSYLITAVAVIFWPQWLTTKKVAQDTELLLVKRKDLQTVSIEICTDFQKIPNEIKKVYT